MLQSMGSQGVGHDSVTEQQQRLEQKPNQVNVNDNDNRKLANEPLVNCRP